MKNKKCFKCEKTLLLKEFYKHKQMPDGHLNKCKECTKIDVKKRESELREDPEWVENEKKRHREKYHKLGYKEKYPRKPEEANLANRKYYDNNSENILKKNSEYYKLNPNKKREVIKKYNQKYPEKYLAHKYTELFLTKKSGINLHHWSYNQEDWLDVIELTVKDHNFLHRFMTYDQEKMIYRNLEGILLDSKESHIEYLEFCKTNYK